MVSGRAVEVSDRAERETFAGATGNEADGGYELFRIDLDQVVLTALAEDKSALVISSWRPGRGLTETRRV